MAHYFCPKCRMHVLEVNMGSIQLCFNCYRENQEAMGHGQSLPTMSVIDLDNKELVSRVLSEWWWSIERNKRERMQMAAQLEHLHEVIAKGPQPQIIVVQEIQNAIRALRRPISSGRADRSILIEDGPEETATIQS